MREAGGRHHRLKGYLFMQVTATTPLREHEKPMSWPRAVVIAVGFFFMAAMMAGQLPSYMFTISTLSTLSRFEQGTLTLSLLAIGIGLLCFEIAMLYDPRPLVPWPLFFLLGGAITIVGLFFLYQVFVGPYATNAFGAQGWPMLLPSAIKNGSAATYWPAGTPYLFNPAWFQLNSIDISSVGMIATVIGLGMIGFAALNPLALAGRLAGPLHALAIRFSMGLALVIVAIYVTLYTFNPTAIMPANDGAHGPAGNILLFIGMLLALFALQLWLLPVMVANRAQFMPATYLHGVIGLIGNVGVPLLIIWAAVYPVVNWAHGVDTQQTWVECSQKTVIPGSCTFTPFTGYIICAIVFSLTFGLLVLGLYFWSTRRNTVVLGVTIGIIFMGLAVTLIHTDDPAQVPMGLMISIALFVLAFAWTWATQREFASTQAQPLGCTGQWLVLGTLLFFYLAGFSLFSMPNFFETEALALFYQPGHGGLHDAFWGLLIMGGLALLQLAIFVRHKPMSDLRKFVLWALGIGVAGELIAAIMGFHTDVLTQGINAMQGSQAFFLTGGLFQLGGILIAFFGAMRARSAVWMVIIGSSTLIGFAVAIVMHSLPQAYPELVVFGVVLAAVGAFAYSALGPDLPPEEEYEANGSFVVTPAGE